MMAAALSLPEYQPVDYGPDQAAVVRYRAKGRERALALGNSGPIRFDEQGNLHPGSLAAYWRCGFHIFQGVLEQDALDDLERDVAMCNRQAIHGSFANPRLQSRNQGPQPAGSGPMSA